VLKKLFGKWAEELRGYLGSMHNCEFRDLYISLNIATLIIVACMQPEKYVNFVRSFGSTRKK
jgi:hypothetical protein